MAKPRMLLSDIAKEEGPHVYVQTHASRLTKMPAHVILTHRSGQDAQSLATIEIPVTWIPFDLSAFAPKEELIRNTFLLGLINKGILSPVSTDEAEEILRTPEAILESERLLAERMSHVAPEKTEEDRGPVQAPPVNLPPTSRGDADETASAVSSSVVGLFSSGRKDEDIAVMLRSLLDLITEEDVRYIRGNTNSPVILSVLESRSK